MTQIALHAGRQESKKIGVAFVVLVLMVLLPVDWFSVTGESLREVGSKPATLWLILMSVAIFFIRSLLNINLRFPSVIIVEAALILFSGLFAFFLSISAERVSFAYFKNPVIQFINQTSLLIAFFFVIFSVSNYLQDARCRTQVVKMLPWAAFFHLSIFMLEAVGVFNDNEGWLLFFRVDGGAIERPTGLMSEPSYFGVFASLFGMPLLLLDFYRTLVYRFLAVVLLLCAYYINAKTMFIVIAFQLAAYFFFRWNQLSSIKIVLITLVCISAGVLMATEQKTFDLEENLSSVNRFGSTQLGINLASAGYGASGVGFGQFHYFYKEVFAPPYLALSKEATMQFEPTAPNRASAYNLYVRFLVETGFIGLLLFLDITRRALKNARFSEDPASQFGVLLISGSAGFLMTQDTYFYPPLALGLALAFSSKRTNALTHK